MTRMERARDYSCATTVLDADPEGEVDYRKLHALFNSNGEQNGDSNGAMGKGAGMSEGR